MEYGKVSYLFAVWWLCWND